MSVLQCVATATPLGDTFVGPLIAIETCNTPDMGSSTRLVEQKRALELVPASPKRSSEKNGQILECTPVSGKCYPLSRYADAGASRTPNSAFALFGAYEPGCVCNRNRALQGQFPLPPPKLRRHNGD